MKQQRSQPKWWQLRLIVPLMLALLVLDHHYLSLSPLGHQLVLAAIVLLVYGLMGYWLYANQAELPDETDEKEAWPAAEDPASDEQFASPEPVAPRNHVVGDHPTPTALPANSASVELHTKNGAAIRTWLN
ncbi:MAG TPA: hypothetical protein PKE45_13465 [Caldilineaceae bacterium]|nr:hypothetical protein [Caldilineaceae bacterium]